MTCEIVMAVVMIFQNVTMIFSPMIVLYLTLGFVKAGESVMAIA